MEWVCQCVQVITQVNKKGFQAGYMEGWVVNNILKIVGKMGKESKKKGDGAIMMKAIKGDPFSQT